MILSLPLGPKLRRQALLAGGRRRSAGKFPLALPKSVGEVPQALQNPEGASTGTDALGRGVSEKALDRSEWLEITEGCDASSSKDPRR